MEYIPLAPAEVSKCHLFEFTKKGKINGPKDVALNYYLFYICLPLFSLTLDAFVLSGKKIKDIPSW